MNRFIPEFLSVLAPLGLVRSTCVHRIAAIAMAIGVLSGATSTAWAQSAPGLRSFPPGTQRGTLVVGQHPDIRVNGLAERLSPGARIHGPDNLILLSSVLMGQKLLVNFVREPHGLVHEVWILTPAEASTPAP